QRLDVGLGLVAAVAGRGAVERRLDRGGEPGGACADDRLVQDERPAGGVLRGEVGVLLEPPDAEAQVHARQRRLEGGDDLRERGAGAGRQSGGESVDAVRVGHRARLVRVGDVVAVYVHVDGYAWNPRLARVAEVVVVRVVEHQPVDFIGAVDVGEIDAGALL